MKRLILTILVCAGTSPSMAADARAINGAAALAVAGAVAPYSPLLPAVYKKAVEAIFDGHADSPFKDAITITADKIVCRTSNVDITARSCELTFGKSTEKLTGRAANEIYATLAMAGIPSDGAAGSMFESLSKLDCTLDPAALKDKGGGGATCNYEPAN
ncbi:hypothetical protein [Bradyrhizobium sp. STM 3843]|uniref:hypothetical protein n=1 Tax=Bradyrhizobium sp. STM 3843 TaxID=551947 RepID=UPI00031BFE6D|nr:hypothetical protein [Bradyrhizobium sp. STM 3843]